MKQSIRLFAASIPMLLAPACSSDNAAADETGTTGSASSPTLGSTPSTESTNVTAATTGTGSAGTASAGGPTDTAGEETTATSSETSATSSGETGTTDFGDVGSSGETQTTVGESSSGDTGSSETTADANSAPVILALSASPAVLTGTGSVLIVAIVTDPDGISDVIGGTIASPEGTVYGALASSAEEGAYELELSWADLNTFVEINIDPNQAEEREFEVTLFDQAGASVTDSVSVTLESFFDDYAVCAGASVSLLSDANCGVCGFSCLDDLGSQLGPGGECSNGDWCEKSAQVNVYASDTTCDAACAAAAGPQTPYSGTIDCQVVGGTCPFFPVPNPLSTCPGLSLNTLPSLGCLPADDETFLRCTCWGIYEP